jgi:N-acyl-D-amino-acid deacylase
MLDIKFEGATVIDGTGAAGSRTDVGLSGDRITAVGDLSREPAGRTVSVAGRVIAPGFIDMHSHSDWSLWANRRAESKVRQGVTTEVVGNCGFSPAPASDEHLEDLRGFALRRSPGLDFRWRSMGEYLDAFDADGTALNVVQLVGHGALRIAAMGFARRPPTGDELKTMQRLLADAIEQGAWGLSTGLIYAPGSFATTEEIVEVARAMRRRGLYASHIRGEGATLLDAVREAIRIGEEGDLPVQVSHIKAAGRPNWGKVTEALALIDEAVAGGLDIMADVYPYTASSTSLRTLLPDWAQEDGLEAMVARLGDPEVRERIRREVEAPANGQGLAERIGWDNVLISYCSRRKDAVGKRLSEIAAARGQSPLEAAIELIVDEQGQGAMILFQLDERDLRRALGHARVMIGSDGFSLAPYGPLGEGVPHPRSYGTFPRVLGEYVREQRTLSLAKAVHKMTGLPAQRLGFKDRGFIRKNAQADLVVFDPKTVGDQATYQQPHRYPAGIEHVLVNGCFVIKDGQHTGSLPGRVLRLP